VLSARLAVTTATKAAQNFRGASAPRFSFLRFGSSGRAGEATSEARGGLARRFGSSGRAGEALRKLGEGWRGRRLGGAGCLRLPAAAESEVSRDSETDWRRRAGTLRQFGKNRRGIETGWGGVTRRFGSSARAGEALRRPCLSLACHLSGAHLTDHRDADRAGVGQLVFDAPCDVAREHRRLVVVHLVVGDDDANLATGLDSE
jgi:hypothetical protein